MSDRSVKRANAIADWFAIFGFGVFTVLCVVNAVYDVHAFSERGHFILDAVLGFNIIMTALLARLRDRASESVIGEQALEELTKELVRRTVERLKREGTLQ